MDLAYLASRGCGRWTFVALAAASFMGAAGAQVLPASLAALSVRAGAGPGGDSHTFRGSGFQSLSASGSFTTAQFTGTAQASAAIQAGPSGAPMAVVDLSGTWPCCGSTAGVTGIGSASFTYYSQVAAVMAPPVAVPLLPIIITDFVSASVAGSAPPQGGSGSMSAQAFVYRNRSHATILLDRATASGRSDTESHANLAAITASVGEVFGISISASGTAGGGGNYGGSASGHAVADPVFSFDQAAFDLYSQAHGFASFNLNDYYSFEYSQGVLGAVPEPAAPWLFAAGLGLIAARRRKPA